jgi:hypothetical protein
VPAKDSLSSACKERRRPSLHTRFGDIETGIYTLANDVTLDWFVAFCNSVRRHDPDLPLIVIPYDDRVERLTRLAGRYGFEMFADSQLGSLDEIGRQMSSTGLSGMFRKLSVFWGPLTHFAYLDADLVMLSSINPAIEAIIQRRADLTGLRHVPHAGLPPVAARAVPKNPQLQRWSVCGPSGPPDRRDSRGAEPAGDAAPV